MVMSSRAAATVMLLLLLRLLRLLEASRCAPWLWLLKFLISFAQALFFSFPVVSLLLVLVFITVALFWALDLCFSFDSSSSPRQSNMKAASVRRPPLSPSPRRAGSTTDGVIRRAKKVRLRYDHLGRGGWRAGGWRWVNVIFSTNILFVCSFY